MSRTARTATVAACVAASLALAGCAGDHGGTAGAGSSTLNIATMTLPQSLDPAVATGSALPYFQAVYDTLIKREPDGTFSPMLATEWTYNKEHTALALTLRKDVQFADGTAFDGAAVKANLERFQKGGGASAKWLNDLEAVDVTDATHVTLKLKQPNPAMEFYLSDAPGLMANPGQFAKGDSLKTTPDGTGPYRLDKTRTTVGTKWSYSRNADYWGKELPYKNINISFFDNETAITNGLKTGQINAALLQTSDQQIAIESDPKVKTEKQEFDFQGLLLFDRDGKITPALRDPRVRQALNYAVDRDTMLDRIRQNRGRTTSQVFGPETQAYDKKLDTYYAHDPAKAKSLLKQAGYGDGFTLKLPRITAIVNDALAASLQSDFKAIGVKLVWDTLDGASAVQKVFKDRQYSGMVMNMGQSTSDWAAADELVTPGAFNMFGTTDKVTRMLLPALKAGSEAEAKSAARELNQHLVEEAWFVPFYRMSYLHVSDGTVRIAPQSGMAVPSIYNYAPAK
ncbi:MULTISPECIES: ABC transporter substrate-binding protein [unclassified Streptomyces]|uniref:ABC transporter substrate-binding protein n=1 Tax=unclassified Streptomyces TaxID=2593676 RepID=UPI002E81694E|nr:ABC transporter substrate-binding protein [Streptomyces sp. NBC_00523]WUD03243.1 ABC transporter substrate-binding protein [Streptomyces sp. NBC_00523]